MDRPTTKFNTPSGKEVVIKTYLTGREKLQLQEALLAEMKVKLPGAGVAPEIQEVPGSVLVAQEKKLIELAIVSYDGSATDVYNRIMDLPSDEYDSIKAEVDKITGSNFTKGTSPTPGTDTSPTA